MSRCFAELHASTSTLLIVRQSFTLDTSTSLHQGYENVPREVHKVAENAPKHQLALIPSLTYVQAEEWRNCIL